MKKEPIRSKKKDILRHIHALRHKTNKNEYVRKNLEQTANKYNERQSA
jgi:hypothetical protein